MKKTLTLEEGKHYRTRDGRVIGPLRKAINGFRAYNGQMSFIWWVDGSAARGTCNPGDLVSEVTEWEGPGTEFHEYSPDIAAMGDCSVCGHVQEAHSRYIPKNKPNKRTLMTNPTLTMTTTVQRDYRVELKKLDILDLLKTAGADFGDRQPSEISVTVRVPGGGDWSNTDLELNDSPVVVTWTEVEKP